MQEAEELLDLAEAYLEAAEALASTDSHGDLGAPTCHNALMAAELAGKSLLLQATGAYPRSHQIAGVLSRHGLIPIDLEGRQLNRLFEMYNRVRYDASPTEPADVGSAIRCAQSLVQAAREWPSGE